MNKDINYLNKAHIPIVKNPDKTSLANRRKENEFCANNG